MIELVAETQTKRCFRCKEVKPLSEYVNDKSRADGKCNECKDCKRVRSQVLRGTKAPSGMYKHREYSMRRMYGIEPIDYLRMYAEQAGKCAVCGAHKAAAGFSNDKHGMLVIDHDHSTNGVRGLLCHECNLLLGYMELKRAYLLNALRYIRTNGREAEIGA